VSRARTERTKGTGKKLRKPMGRFAPSESAYSTAHFKQLHPKAFRTGFLRLRLPTCLLNLISLRRPGIIPRAAASIVIVATMQGSFNYLAVLTEMFRVTALRANGETLVDSELQPPRFRTSPWWRIIASLRRIKLAGENRRCA